MSEQIEDWAAVKLRPSRTGLPMAVWITENESYDVRVKVSRFHGRRGTWASSPSVGVRPTPHEIIDGSLDTDDLKLAKQWIELNRDVIIDLWNGAIDPIDAGNRLQRLP